MYYVHYVCILLLLSLYSVCRHPIHFSNPSVLSVYRPTIESNIITVWYEAMWPSGVGWQRRRWTGAAVFCKAVNRCNRQRRAITWSSFWFIYLCDRVFSLKKYSLSSLSLHVAEKHRCIDAFRLVDPHIFIGCWLCVCLGFHRCGHNGAVKADRLRTMQLVWIQWEYISQRARSLMFWYFSRNSV